MRTPSSGREVSGKLAPGGGVTQALLSPGEGCCGGEWEANQSSLGSAERGPRVNQQQ